MAHIGHTARLVAIRVSKSTHSTPNLAHISPYPLLNISTPTSLTKGQPCRPERSTYGKPPSSTESPSLTDNAPQVLQTAVLPSPSPTGHPSVPRTIREAHYLSSLRAASPPTPDSTLPEADPPVVASRSGQTSPTPTNPTPSSETTIFPPPIVENPPTRGHIDGTLLSRGSVRARLAWVERRETKRRRINTAKNTIYACGSLADTSASISPNHLTY